MQEAYFELDSQGHILDCNQAGAELVHANLNEIMDMNILEICADPPTTERKMDRVLLTGYAEYSAVISLVCLDGAIIHAEFSLSPVVDEQGNIKGLRAIGRDITQRKEYEKQLEHLSLYDQLTGQYNRAYFENEMERLSKSREYPITILSIDLDGLKLVNDTMGHEQGDNLLVACAGILKKSFRTSDVLAIVDVFEAMIHERPYQPARTQGEAIRELWRCSGAQFDPGLVQVFVRAISRQADDVMFGQAY